MEALAWVAVALLGLVCGWQFITYLTTVPLKMSRALGLTLLSLFLVIGIVVLAIEGVPSRWIAVALAVVFAVVGYVLSARRVLGREDGRVVPKLERRANDPGEGHTAVVYFTHGEPEIYDPIGWLNQFREFDEQGIAFVPFIARPFFLKALRDAYLRVGMSQHRHRHLAMASDVEQCFTHAGTPTSRSTRRSSTTIRAPTPRSSRRSTKAHLASWSRRSSYRSRTTPPRARTS